ncbi:MAG: hypothetical protein AAB472_03705 [Patescibacteria group bacterium]
MKSELTNLLPHERSRSLTREYFLRLVVVALSGLIVVILGSGVLLIPSYLYLNQEIQLKEKQAADIDARLSSTEGKEANVRLLSLTQNANYLSRLATTSSATAAVKAVLNVPRNGITLTGFTYTPASAKGIDGKMTLKGTASTRETLRAYVAALAALPFVSNADLPISAYAKENNIPFVITLTGTLLP